MFPLKTSDDMYPTKNHRSSLSSTYNEDSMNSSDESFTSEENYIQRYEKILNSAFHQNYIEESTSSLCSSPSSSLFGNSINDDILNGSIENLQKCPQQQTSGESRITDNAALISQLKNNSFNIDAEEILSNIGLYSVTHKIPERFLRICYSSQKTSSQNSDLNNVSCESLTMQDSIESVVDRNDYYKQQSNRECSQENSVDGSCSILLTNNIGSNEVLDQQITKDEVITSEAEKISDFEESFPILKKKKEDDKIFYKQKSIHEEIEEAQRRFKKVDSSFDWNTFGERTFLAIPTCQKEDVNDIKSDKEGKPEINTSFVHAESLEVSSEVKAVERKYEVNNPEDKTYHGTSKPCGSYKIGVCDLDSTQTSNLNGKIDNFSETPNVDRLRTKKSLDSIEKQSRESFELEEILSLDSDLIESTESKVPPSSEFLGMNVRYWERPKSPLIFQELNSPPPAFSLPLASPFTEVKAAIDRDRLRGIRDFPINVNRNSCVFPRENCEKKQISCDLKMSKKTRRNPLLSQCISSNFRNVSLDQSTESEEPLSMPCQYYNLPDSASASISGFNNDILNSYHSPRYQNQEINRSCCRSPFSPIKVPYITCGMDDVTVYSSDDNSREIAPNLHNYKQPLNGYKYSTSMTVYIRNPPYTSNIRNIVSQRNSKNYSKLNVETNSLKVHNYSSCDFSRNSFNSEEIFSSNIRNISSFENKDQKLFKEGTNNLCPPKCKYYKYENIKTSFRSEVTFFVNVNNVEKNQSVDDLNSKFQSNLRNSSNKETQCCQSILSLHKATQTDLSLDSGDCKNLNPNKTIICVRCLCNVCSGFHLFK